MGRGPSLKTLEKKAKAVAKGKRLGELEADAKKGDEQYTKDLIRGLVEKIEPSDLIIFAGLVTYYGYVLKHAIWFAAMEAAIDLGLIHTRSEAGSAAFIAHAGFSALPNLANQLDKLTGGPGNVWEDFLEALRRAGLIPGDEPIPGSSGAPTT